MTFHFKFWHWNQENIVGSKNKIQVKSGLKMHNIELLPDLLKSFWA